jgi:hypothetical protein
MSLLRHPVTALFLLAGLASCGGASTGAFPSRGEIDTIAAAPLPSGGGLDDRSVDVPSWQLHGAPAEAIEVATANDPTPWGAMLASAAGARPGLVVASQAMACVAREAAAFVAERGALPAQPVRRFIAARCGAVSTDVWLSSQAGSVPAAVQEAEIVQKWGPQVQSMVQEGLQGGSRFAGVGYARLNDRAAVVLATSQRRAHVERTPVVAANGMFVLRGELLAPAAHIEALVTRGRFGYAECMLDPNAALPRFGVACPVAADDPSAWIEIAAFPAGRVLGESVVDVQVFPTATPDGLYLRVMPTVAFNTRDAGILTGVLLDRLNAVRRDAGLGLVRLSPAQTRKAAALAPHYFAAMGGHGDATVADKIALGLQAGWDVEGVVREGHFATGRAELQSPDDLVGQACASPFGRRALLDPEIQSVAIGTVTAGGVVGAVISTYSLDDPRRGPDESAAVLARLGRLRAARRLAAPAAVPQLAGLTAKVLERVRAGESPDDAMHWLLENAAEQMRGRRVHVWVSQATAVDRLDMPAELLREPSVALAVGVAHHKPEGEPWARLVVFFVTVEEQGPTNTASSSAGRHG